MKKTLMLIALLPAMGVAFAQNAAPTEPLTQAQVRARLTEQGYTNINDVKFEDGVWKADARSAEGERVDLQHRRPAAIVWVRHGEDLCGGARIGKRHGSKEHVTRCLSNHEKRGSARRRSLVPPYAFGKVQYTSTTEGPHRRRNRADRRVASRGKDERFMR